MWSLLLLAATVGSFAHLPLVVPDYKKWCCDQDVKVVPGATLILKKNTRSVRSVVKRRFDVVATSRLSLCWMCDWPRMACAWRITPICIWHEQAMIEWPWRDFYCCLLSQCEALCTCCSCFLITALPIVFSYRQIASRVVLPHGGKIAAFYLISSKLNFKCGNWKLH